VLRAHLAPSPPAAVPNQKHRLNNNRRLLSTAAACQSTHR